MVGWVQVPIMLRSSYCSLFDHSDKELTDLGECPYDQVGLITVEFFAAGAAAASAAWAKHGSRAMRACFPSRCD